MSGQPHFAGSYTVPTYRAPADAVFFHVLHGHVPRHQIDFIYRPEIPQGVLSQQHFSHLSRLMKYIEPREGCPFAFAIGNLSRDDTQHEPGRGGVGLLFSMRVSGATDHAGRQDPTFTHAAVMVGRQLDERMLFELSASFYDRMLGGGNSSPLGMALYREYVRLSLTNPVAVLPILERYVKAFGSLTKPLPSTSGQRWVAQEGAQPKRVVIVHPEQVAFRDVARCASRIAAMLYTSNLRWTEVTTGREADVENGITVRLLGEGEAGAYSSRARMIALRDVPEEEGEIAGKIFGAKAAGGERVAVPELGWRARYEAERGGGPAGGGEGRADSYRQRDLRVMKEVREEAVVVEPAKPVVPEVKKPVVPEVKKSEPEPPKAQEMDGDRTVVGGARREQRPIWPVVLGLSVVMMGVAGGVIFAIGENRRTERGEAPVGSGKGLDEGGVEKAASGVVKPKEAPVEPGTGTVAPVPAPVTAAPEDVVEPDEPAEEKTASAKAGSKKPKSSKKGEKPREDPVFVPPELVELPPRETVDVPPKPEPTKPVSVAASKPSVTVSAKPPDSSGLTAKSLPP